MLGQNLGAQVGFAGNFTDIAPAPLGADFGSKFYHHSA
jgi:hypothetical protein